MKTMAITKSALRAIGRNKLRSGLMMIGVMVGVGAMTVVSALGEGTVKRVMNRIESSFGANDIYISAGGGAMHGPRRGDGPTTTLTLADMDAIQERIPNVDMIAASVSPGNKMVSYMGVNKEVRITGHSENARYLYRPAVTGSFFGREDVQGSTRVAIIGQDVATDLFGLSDPIGEQLRIGTVPFEVIGTLEQGGVDMHGINRDNEIFVPVTTAMRRLMNVDYISSAKLHVRDANAMAATAESIEGLLRERHHLATDEARDFGMVTPVQVKEMVASNNRTFTVFLPLISGVAILVGAMIIASLMLVSVNERRPEIGLRKAVGARPKDIRLQFLVESIVITVVAGVAGLAVGGVGSQVMLLMQDKPPILPWNAMLLGLATSIAVGLLAGVVPARRAALLDPVETLR